MIPPTGSGRVHVHNDLFMVSAHFLQTFSQLFMKQRINERVLQWGAHVQNLRYWYTKSMFPFGLKYISLKFN